MVVRQRCVTNWGGLCSTPRSSTKSVALTSGLRYKRELSVGLAVRCEGIRRRQLTLSCVTNCVAVAEKLRNRIRKKHWKRSVFNAFLVRVFITDLILRHSAEVVETYSQSTENACVYKEFCNTKGIWIMEKYITQNGIKYELRGEQYYPMLEISRFRNIKKIRYNIFRKLKKEQKR